MTRNDSKRSSTASVQQKLLFSTIPTANNPDPPQATVAAVTPGNNLQHTQEEAPNDTNTESPANAPAILRTSLRYRVILDVKPNTTTNKNLLEVFSDNVKMILTIAKKVAGDNLWLGTWDEEQETTEFPIIKTIDQFPSGKSSANHSAFAIRNAFTIYTNSYVNPKKDGGKVWLQLRFIHEQPLRVPLPKLGEHLQDAFGDLPFQVQFNRHPMHCQASSVACIGWLYGSTKSISEESFTSAIRKALNIPEQVAFGIQWRTITDRLGKRPPFDQDNPPPSALHLDVDKRFAHPIQKRAAELWRKHDKNKNRRRLPNDIQLRLVPCFSSETSDARKSSKTEDNVVLMAGKQKYFVNQCIEKVDVPFIRFLDTPISTNNTMTLRRAMMARAPSEDPTKRLIHNVDFLWNNAHRVQATTIKKYFSQTHEFVSTLIPEMVYKYGPDCQHWFTEDGLSYFANVTWNPDTLSTTSATDKVTQDLVDEDLWDLGDDWKAFSSERQPPITGTSVLKPQKLSRHRISLQHLEQDDDVQSFASAFGVEHTSETSPPGEDTGQTKADGVVRLSESVLNRLNSAPSTQSAPDDHSMSTAARTTDSTRVRLQAAKSTITEQALEIERLRQQLHAQSQLDFPKPPRMLFDVAPVATTVSRNDVITAVTTPLPNTPPRAAFKHQELIAIESPVIDIDSNSPSMVIETGSDFTQNVVHLEDDEDEATANTESDNTAEIIANLESKFSKAKKTSASTVQVDTRPVDERSPPKKVRFTASSASSDQGESPSSPDVADIHPSVSFTVHHPTTNLEPAIDSVDSGQGA